MHLLAIYTIGLVGNTGLAPVNNKFGGHGDGPGSLILGSSPKGNFLKKKNLSGERNDCLLDSSPCNALWIYFLNETRVRAHYTIDTVNTDPWCSDGSIRRGDGSGPKTDTGGDDRPLVPTKR